MSDKIAQSGVAAHESFVSEEAPAGASDRSFGLLFTVVFALAGGWAIYHGKDWAPWAFAAAAGFLILALTAAKVLHPLNVAWAWLGAMLHKITQPVILGGIFFLFLLPTGILMRAFGRDPMNRSYEGGPSDTYWIRREAGAEGDHSMKNQF